MIEYGLKFHHLGLAVSQPDKAIDFLRGLGYSIGEPVYDELQNVNLIFCTSSEMPAVELIYKAESEGPLENVLKANKEIIYHTCYETLSLQLSLKNMSDGGNRVMCVSSAKPALLFGSKKVSFYYVVGFGLIEIIET